MSTDLQRLNDRESWPNYPLLPMIKLDDSPDFNCGVVTATDLKTVYVVNVFNLDPNVRLSEQLSTVQKHTYASSEDLLKEWEID